MPKPETPINDTVTPSTSLANDILSKSTSSANDIVAPSTSPANDIVSKSTSSANDIVAPSTSPANDAVTKSMSPSDDTMNGAPKDVPTPTPGPTPTSPRPPIRPKRKIVKPYMVCHHCERKLFLEDSSEHAYCADCKKLYRIKPRDN
jgi:hypothetical protein